MILQTLLFSHREMEVDESLYIRRADCMEKFDTYFNLFSIRKWLHYTVLTDFFLELDIEGNLTIVFSDQNEELKTVEVHSDTRGKVRIKVPYTNDSAIITFVVKHHGDSKLYGGAYLGDEKVVTNPVRLALAICTFRREGDLLRNVRLLEKTLLDTKTSSLADKIGIFISDNGRSLSTDMFNHAKVRIFPNCNAGGSGGFTRCLIEIMKCRKEYGYTHAILMDDDVLIEPDAFIRTYALLSYLRPEYKNACISGAMLRRDLPYIQHENGARWEGDNPITRHPGLDLRDADVLADNEAIVQSDYAAWWYGCYSLDLITRIGLPLPIFLHVDDTEYGIRAAEEIILLNGVCVWHESFENKRASSLFYYDIRNLLLVNTIHREDYGFVDMFKLTFRRLLPCIVRYRYQDVKLLCMGIEDYCRGIDWLMSQNPEHLHQKIMESSYVMRPVHELTKDKRVLEDVKRWEKPHDVSKIYGKEARPYSRKAIVTLNGWLLPAYRKEMRAYPLGIWPYTLYRQKQVLLFDPDTQKGIVVRKSYRNAFASLFLYVKAVVRLGFKYKRVREEYRMRKEELTSVSFWNMYLGLNK